MNKNFQSFTEEKDYDFSPKFNRYERKMSNKKKTQKKKSNCLLNIAPIDRSFFKQRRIYLKEKSIEQDKFLDI